MQFFEGKINGTATIISDNEFEINLPLNQIWLLNTSDVDVTIGISYNRNRFKYQPLHIFDSKCRYCDGSINNEEIKVKASFNQK